MCYIFEFDSVNSLLQGRFNGEVTDAIVMAYYHAVREHASRIHPRAAILDLTDVTSFEVTPQTMRDLAEETPVIPDVTVPRFVIAPSDYMFGMVHMFQMLGDEARPHLHVVRTREEAYAKLGIH